MQRNMALTDCEQISEIVALLYQSVQTSNWQPFLDKIMRATSSNKALIFLKDLESKSPPFLNIAANFDYSEQALLTYLSRSDEDPFYQATLIYPEGDICEPSKLVNLNQIENTDIYQKTFKPMKTYHALGAIIIRDNRYDSALVLNRGVNDAPFDNDERQLLSLVTPHVQHAMRLFTIFRDISQQNDMLKVVLNQSEKALLVLDADANIKLSNQQADTLLTNLPYWRCKGNQFSLKSSVDQLRMGTLLKQCMQNNVLNQDRLYLQLTDTDMQICLALAPLHWLQLDNDTKNLCLLTIDFQQRISWQGIQEEYSLTARELELVQALYNNQKLIELSEQMNISYHTLRRHLQTIFTKCRIKSQSELILLLGRFRH